MPSQKVNHIVFLRASQVNHIVFLWAKLEYTSLVLLNTGAFYKQ